MIVSREAKKKQVICELFACSTTLKFINTLNKPPSKLYIAYIVIKDSVHLTILSQIQ